MFSRRCASSAFRRLAAAGGRRAAALVISAAVLASVVGVGSAAQAAHTPRSKAATASVGSVCGTAVSASSALTPARAAGVSPFDIAKWFGEKAGGAIAGKAGGMAFDYVTKLPYLKDIVPQSEGAQTLAELAKIEGQLAGVSARLDLIGTQVDVAIGELRAFSLASALDTACGYVDKAETVYQHYYVPVLQAGLTLGYILKSDHPGHADVLIGELPEDLQKLYTTVPAPQCGGHGLEVTCYTPKSLVAERLKNFVEAEKPEIGAAGRLSKLLRPNALTSSVLTAYGKYIMAHKRYLTRADSESLLGLYSDLAQGEALASWMEAEYFTVYTVNETSEHVFRAYGDDSKAEHDGLPPMIPVGDVIDLEQMNAETTHYRPLWALLRTSTMSYWQAGVESNNDVLSLHVDADSAGLEVKAFNNRQSCSIDAPPCFKAWRIPSTVDLKALLSQNCQVDRTTNPPQLPKTCQPLVPGPGYPDVASYLAKLGSSTPAALGTGNPANSDWKSVFSRPDQTFIWTTDSRSHTTECGYQKIAFYKDVFSRRYSFRVGLPLTFTTSPLNFTNLNQTWPIYPIMPSQIPDYKETTSDEAHRQCDYYAAAQIYTGSNLGIVLVTDNTGVVDFMAQPGNAAVQDATARQIAQTAAVDSERYARDNHGSFVGLGLVTLRHRVPEARSGEPAYLIAAHAIDGGTGFIVTARAEGTADTFTITYGRSGSALRTCTRIDGGAGRYGCQHLTGRHGRW